MVKYNIIIDKEAFQMLDNHLLFLTRVSPKSAKSLKQTFINALRTLEYNPDYFPIWQPDFETYKSYHNILIKKRYLVIYYIEKDNIFVDYLLDCRMDNNKLF